MPSETNEAALETAIENHLNGNGYISGTSADFSSKYGIDETRFWHFLEETQPDELAKLQRQSDWKLRILERLDRLIKKYGVLRLFKKGLEVDDAHFTMLYQLPPPSSGHTVKENFLRNEFSLTRQVGYSIENPLERIDMVLFVNGLPFATMELKNHWTHQNAKVHGQNQYKFKRDNKQPLLEFGRCLVHLAVDTDEVYMATRLSGAATFFLPFNKGHNYGKGNPPNPNGHKSAYLWENILTRESVADIIQHFVWLDGREADALSRRTLYFPRFHQLAVVRKILADVSTNGVGKRYLIQHSAGSGKSNSITWVAFQLIAACPASEEAAGGKGLNAPLFDSVIVVTDRKLLDKQLRDNIRDFSEVKNIVAPALTSEDLKNHLQSGKRIIITTIHKFPYIVEGIADLSDKRFAVIIDEAHSSQSGSSADNLNRTIAGDQDEFDAQEKILEIMRSRRMSKNASYLAFTATPKEETLEKFGEKQPDGTFDPFDLYSMKQAIEEGFILDVLTNYTTYRSYYEIEKSIAENPLFDTIKAQKKLRGFVERHPKTIETKAEIMLDHFLTKIVNTKRLKGKAKALVATQNIEAAIRYYQSLCRNLSEKGNPFKILIAFSGEKWVDGNKYHEAGINGFSETDTRGKFDEDDYRILVVANKYLTGFDQPKLTAMYIDKKLQEVQAVQALSRLNRSADRLGKKSEDLFILDFFNSTEDIKKAFDPFYTSTTLSEATNINVLHEVKAILDNVGVYEWSEVEDFIEKYFNSVDAQELSPIIDTAADRFNTILALEDEEKADFKIKAKQFVKIYSQMASIMPYEVVKWEKLFWFLKFLIPKLIIRDPKADELDELLNSVDLSTYGLQRVRLNASIGLDPSETELEPQNPNPRGAYGGDKEENELEAIVRTFNERWFHGWEATPAEQRVKFITIAKNIQDHPDFREKYSENPDIHTRNLAFEKIFDQVIGKQRKNELDLYRLYSKDEAFKKALQDSVRRMLRMPRLFSE